MSEDDSRGENGFGARSSAPAHPATYLVREIGALGGDLDRAMGRHLAVNPTDLRAMSVLLGRGPMSTSELAAALGLGAPATSMAVDRLERLGHVTRERSGPDRRRVAIRATPTSADRARLALMPMIREIDSLLDDLHADDRRVVQRYLHDVVAIMRRTIEQIPEHPPAT